MMRFSQNLPTEYNAFDKCDDNDNERTKGIEKKDDEKERKTKTKMKRNWNEMKKNRILLLFSFS